MRLPGIDILRGLAAFAVLTFHLTNAAEKIDSGFPVFEIGAFGVNVFFVISGYVILLTAYRTPDRCSFVLARLIRLYPAYVSSMCLTSLVMIGFQASVFNVPPIDWLANLTMLPFLFGARPVDPIYYTLWYEIGFYTFVAVFLPCIKRGYGLHLCGGFLLLVAVFPIPDQIAGFTTYFVMGMALCELDRSPCLGLVILIGAMVSAGPPWLGVAAVLPVALSSRLRIPVWLNGFASTLGAISYPLYLLHNRIGCILVIALGLGSLGASGAFVCASAIVVGLALITNRYLEAPAMAALKRWTRDDKPGQRRPRPLPAQ
jgi:peptidoglycan/LPS O-acetylase OafA/YrhL